MFLLLLLLVLAPCIIIVIDLVINVVSTGTIHLDDAPGYLSFGYVYFLEIPLLVLLLITSVYATGKDNHWREIHNVLSRDKQSVEFVEQANEAKNQMNKMISALEAKKLGQSIVTRNTYNVIASGNARVEQNLINGDYLRESASILKESDDKFADALLIFAGYLDSMQLAEAKSAFNDLNKNIKDGASKTTIKSIWKGIVDVVPEVVKVSGAAVQISKYVGLLL